MLLYHCADLFVVYFQNRDLVRRMTHVLAFEERGGTQGMDDLKQNGGYSFLQNSIMTLWCNCVPQALFIFLTYIYILINREK